MLRGWAGEECIFVPLPGQGVGLSPARGGPRACRPGAWHTRQDAAALGARAYETLSWQLAAGSQAPRDGREESHQNPRAASSSPRSAGEHALREACLK